MKTLLYPLLFLTTIILLVSCQREAEENLPPFVNTGDSLVSKIITLDTSFASGSDTAQVLVFTYDASGRLIQIVNTYYNPGFSGPGRLDNIEESNYLFTGAQTLPDRLEVKYTDVSSGTVDNDNSFYTYTDGYLSRDSLRNHFGSTSVMTFARLTPSRFKVLVKTDIGGFSYTDTMYSNLTWSSGNLIKEVDSLYHFISSAWQVDTVNASYDTKPNPFKEVCIPLPTPFSTSMAGLGLTLLELPSTNNLVSVSGTSPMNFTMTYEYGPTGIPKIARDDEGIKYFFYYTAH